MRRSALRLVVLVISIALVTVLAPSGAARAAEPQTRIGQVCAVSPAAQETCVDAYLDGSIAEGLPAQVQPKLVDARTVWTVGVGWYVYLYLNPGDVASLKGLGYAAATAWLCWAMTSTGVGAIVCGAASYIIYETIVTYHGRVPAGHCLELKFRTWLNGHKIVRRNC